MFSNRTFLRQTVRSLVVFLLATSFLLLFLAPQNAEATLKYRKQTGKKCTFCHSSVPDPGDEDPKLNEEGRKFKENGYKLTEDQKDG